MRASLLVPVLLALFLPSVASSSPATDRLVTYLNSAHERAGVPGFTFAIVRDDQIQTGMRGTLPTGAGLDGDVDTPFVVGSISKSFTALAVMKLVESGQIDLDGEIGDYLSPLAQSPSAPITVRDLLSHSSGFSTRQGNDAMGTAGLEEATLTAALSRVADWEPASAPGEVWAYSNANYLILGALIEAVSGQTFADYIQAEILAPLGMTDSFVADGEPHGELALGHSPWFGFKRAVAPGASDRLSAPAGGVNSTAADLGRYLAVMMNGEDDIISAAAKTAMMEPASDASAFYGFGWYLDTQAGTVYHSGLTPGVETLAVLVPEERKAAVILVNANSGFGFGESGALMYGFAAEALELDAVSERGVWGRRSLVLVFALSPILFLVGLVQAVRGQSVLQAKSGWSGQFSLWFPLLMTIALAITSLTFIPGMFGTSLQTFLQYQPDFSLLLIATAVTGLIWALARIAIAFAPRLKSVLPA